MIHICLDPSKGMEEHGVMITSLDRAGISRGKPLNKMGQRSLNQGSIIFEDVHIPKDFMIQAPRLDTAVRSAAVFGGVAKAAFDETLRYSKVRIQGGVPIFEHKNVKMRLMGMFKMVEAARASSRRIAMYNAANPLSPSIPHGVAVKCLSTETASAVANKAIHILGAYGLTKEYVIEKLYRDARAGMIEGGSNDALSLRAANYL